MAIIAIVIAMAVYTYISQNADLDNKENIPDEKYTYFINEVIKPDIVVYGDEDPFHESLNHTVIDKLTEENIHQKSDAELRLLVHIDRTGEIELTVEQLLMVKRLVEEENMDMIYIGERHLSTFREYGFVYGDYSEDVRSLAYVGSFYKDQQVDWSQWAGNPYVLHLGWDIYDEELQKKERWRLSDRIYTNIQIFAYHYIQNLKDYKTALAGNWRNFRK